MAKERSSKSASDLASSIPINVISAPLGGFSGLESLVGSRELVPKFWVLLITTVGSILSFVKKTRVFSDFLSAVAGGVDLSDRLTILGRLDEDDQKLSCEVIRDGSVITAEHVCELLQDSSTIAHPN